MGRHMSVNPAATHFLTTFFSTSPSDWIRKPGDVLGISSLLSEGCRLFHSVLFLLKRLEMNHSNLLQVLFVRETEKRMK
jgi:hypothetical protein